MGIEKDTILRNTVEMRFVRKEHIITTIFNKELLDKEEIRTVFKNLYEHRINFSIIIKKFMPSEQDYFNVNFEKVRVKKIYDNNIVDLLVLKEGTKTTIKNISFSDIIEVNATTKKHKVLDIDSDVTRWDLLDL